MRQIWIFLFSTILAILITKGHTLTCYICGDTNLDEFGECSHQFQYDCGPYAGRFPESERIYCRTTRSRAKNNTFTIMKECISEQDHYRTFPEKGYRLDEECDLVDIRGEEVAYCLCRSDYCNKQPIAEQFMAFEEKHPELFGELEETKPPAPPRNFQKFGEAPLKIQQLPANSNSFAAPLLKTPPAIVPINDLRTQKQTVSAESDIRRSQLPARAAGIETEISSIPRPIPNSKEAMELPIMNIPTNPISEGSFVGSGDLRLPRVEQKAEEDSNIAQVMKCIQCGDGNLKSSSDECKRQVQVECQSERSMCFTRQINIGNGLYGMEKMCVLPEQLVNEFGESAREQGCGSSNGGRVQYCACTSPSCNQIPLSQQMQIFHTNPPSRSHNVPELASPDLPPPPSKVQPPHSPPTAELVPPPQPIIPVISRSGSASQPGRSVEPPGGNSFRCAICSESDMADPTADCRGMSEEICDATSRFCVTKQTQISTSSFAMEKKCLSDRESAKFLPGEKIEEGCATSESGMVNYCICSGSLCNRNSLLQQAQMSGVREELEEQRHIEEEKSRLNLIQTPHVPNQKNVGIVQPQPNSPNRLPPVILDEDEDENQLEVARDIGKSEDEIIRDRQKEWARAEIASSSHSFSISKFIFSIFILSTFRLFA